MEFISLAATIFGLVALAGGAAGYFKASRGDSIIKYQQTEISLRDAKVATLEKDLAAVNESCSAKDQIIAQKDDTIVELKKHISYLQDLPQGGEQLKELTAIVKKQATAATKAFKTNTALAKQVKGLLAREVK